MDTSVFLVVFANMGKKTISFLNPKADIKKKKENTAVIAKQMHENEIHFYRFLLITPREILSCLVATTIKSWYYQQ